jgi:hypothetical protein
MRYAGERSARLLLDLGHSDEGIVRSLIIEIGVTRDEALEAIEAARRVRNRQIWASYPR